LKIIQTILICLFVLSFPVRLFSEIPDWPEGEEFIYSVKWSIFRLGTLRLRINDTLRVQGEKVTHTQFFIDSNPLLFFINHHSVYESYFDDRFNTLYFRFDEKIDDVPFDAEYRFDYSDSLISIQITDEKNPSNQIRKAIRFEKKVYDGTALLYALRFHAGASRSDTVRFLSNDRIETVIIRFNSRSFPVSVRFQKNPVLCHYLDGRVFEKTVAGLKGKFQAWISTDWQRVPVMARLKVFIGHVTIELEDWKMWQTM
jgi:hypothetical protein